MVQIRSLSEIFRNILSKCCKGGYEKVFCGWDDLKLVYKCGNG